MSVPRPTVDIVNDKVTLGSALSQTKQYLTIYDPAAGKNARIKKEHVDLLFLMMDYRSVGSLGNHGTTETNLELTLEDNAGNILMSFIWGLNRMCLSGGSPPGVIMRTQGRRDDTNAPHQMWGGEPKNFLIWDDRGFALDEGEEQAIGIYRSLASGSIHYFLNPIGRIVDESAQPEMPPISKWQELFIGDGDDLRIGCRITTNGTGSDIRMTLFRRFRAFLEDA